MKALVLFAGIGQGLYCLVLFLVALFLILLILIQRGRGGGLSGAFGGMGGQSAFGAKAGDTFTKITIIAATVWIVLCLIGVKFLGSGASVLVNSPNGVMGAGAMEDPDLSVELEGNAEAAGDSAAVDSAVVPNDGAMGDGAMGDGATGDGPSLGPAVPSEPAEPAEPAGTDAATESP